ncbi:MAG: S8 family serine peptidase [Candidatus Heimdallarchaeota archaeon]
MDSTLQNYFDLDKCHDYSDGVFGNDGNTGEGITIAVLNGGIAYNHSYFSAGYNSYTHAYIIDEEGNSVTIEQSHYDEHPTMCASIVKQVAPKANIISVGTKDGLHTDSNKGVFEWLLDNYVDKNIKIVSRSVSQVDSSITPSGYDRVEKIIKYLSGNGPHPTTGQSLPEGHEILFVLSSGNSYNPNTGYNVKWPGTLGNYSNIICVGQTTFSENKIIIQGFNDAIQNYDDEIRMECMTPSTGIIGCISENETGVGESSGGSSKSTPIVAGAFALAMEKYEAYNSYEIESLIHKHDAYSGEFYSISKPAPECINETSFEIDYTKLKKYYGYGLLNIKGILNLSDSDFDQLNDYDEIILGYSSTYSTSINPWNPDTDGDMMYDGWEYKYRNPFSNGTGFDPLTPAIGSESLETYGDPDKDGLVNWKESQAGTNPFFTDTDTDGLTDKEEVLGYFVGYPWTFYEPDAYTWVPQNGKITSNPLTIDTDNDNLTDLEEVTGTPITIWFELADGYPLRYHNFTVISDPNNNDTDSDDLSDFEEVSGVDLWTFVNDVKTFVTNIQLHPLFADRDNDSLNDGLEVNGTYMDSSGNKYTINCDPRLADTDSDGANDGIEIINYQINPLDKDTDNDSIEDGEEIISGIDGYVTNPDNDDTDSDNVKDNTEINGIYFPDSDNANGAGYIFTDPTDDDSDNDSINDGEEITTGVDSYITDPTDQDTDNDGLDDNDEINDHLTDPTDTDTDDDSLQDWDELLQDWDELYYYITDPTNDDSDLDLLKDGDEVFIYFTDPNLYDTDSDGISDGEEVLGFYFPSCEGANATGYIFLDPLDDDTDNDGILDGEEVTYGSDGYTTNPLIDDTDHDGLTDFEEINTYNTDPTDDDTDDDDWSDGFEVNTSGTDPTEDDTDYDGIDDKAEFDYWKSRGKTNAQAYAYCDNEDIDNDGLKDGLELLNGADPLDNDSDNDGLLDGLEVNTYDTLPDDSDSDNDGYDDLTEIINDTDPNDPNDYPGAGGGGFGF